MVSYMKRWVTILFVLLFLGGITWYFIERDYEIKQVEALKKVQKERTKLIKNIEKHYNQTVKVIKNTKLYSLEKGKYKEKGTISKDVTLTLSKRDEGMSDEEYFKIEGMDFYISYQDVTPIDNRIINDIYKNYIPYNLDIVVKNADFYDKDQKVLSIQGKKQFTVLGKSETAYYVEFNDTFLSIPKDNVVKEVEAHHSDQKNAEDIAVLNYHFFYDEEQGESCDQIICHEKKTFIEQLNYLKEQQFFTTDMNSFSLYLDGIIQLPEHTVLITIDDGDESVKRVAIPILTEYQMHATVFVITAWYNPDEFTNKYIECHSHTHEMHEAGVCPGDTGKGGGITCLDPEIIKKDLQQSKTSLHGSTVLAYPFYDYNDYAIEQLKNNGFTMAFKGDFESAKPRIDKYKVPRYPVSTDWTMQTFIDVVN